MLKLQKLKSYTEEDIPKVEPRAYWSQRDSQGRHLTFEPWPGEAFSLLRSQLVSYELKSRELIDTWPFKGKRRYGFEDVIVFQFSNVRITLQSDYRAELIKAVCSGQISVLVRGAAKKIPAPGTVGAIKSTFLVATQTLPADFPKYAPYVYTGKIDIPIYEY